MLASHATAYPPTSSLQSPLPSAFDLRSFTRRITPPDATVGTEPHGMSSTRTSAAAASVYGLGAWHESTYEHKFVTVQGSAQTQPRIERRNLIGAEMALRTIVSVTLLEALHCRRSRGRR